MNKKEIEQLIQSGVFPYDSDAKIERIETAISYILLKGRYAYKIKKNIKLSFLDFSTLSKRKHYCYEELRLNKRLAKNIYLGVFPIVKTRNQWQIKKQSKTADAYAVCMKRIDTCLQLDVQLNKQAVTKKNIEEIAKQIATFHIKEKEIKLSYDPFFLSREFADIRNFQSTIKEFVGIDYSNLVEYSIQLSDGIVFLLQDLIRTRVQEGYFKECHGDLHAKNIFLTTPPTIFDCIEFKKEFREIDVLNEIAFLCMDLECTGHAKLSTYFLKVYLTQSGFAFGKKEKLLFTYFKAYRACIRAKVSAIGLSQDSSNKQLQLDVKKYSEAMVDYLIRIADIL
jgi:aminoglycoside phosphotransferase family enzyme